ncbi:MAG: hypothetical protein K6L76_00155 [Agarilytica sp.]
MSLINDALRDLDHRSHGGMRNAKVSLDAGSSPAKGRRQLKKIGLSGAVLLGVAGISTFVTYFSMREAGHQSMHETLNGIAEVSASIKASSNALTNDGVASVQHSEKSVSSTVAEAKSQTTYSEEDPQSLHLFRLTEKLDLAIQRNRLSVPHQANALYFLNEIKKIDAAHPVVHTRWVKIQAQYEAQIKGAIQSSNKGFAQRLLARSDRFGLTAELVDQYQNQVASLRSIEAVASSESLGGTQRASVPQIETAVLNAVAGSEPASIVIAGDATAGLSSANKKPTVSSENYLKPSRETLANSLLIEVKGMFSRGEFTQAEEKLQEFLSASPEATDALVLLFDAYLNAGFRDKAKHLRSEISQQHEAHTYFSAQLAKDENNEVGAISMLERQSPSQNMFLVQNTLLAALYQKNKRHLDAHHLYKKLLGVQPNQSIFLLGYALSADALGEHSRSVNAYKKILSQGQVSPNVMSYIKKRLTVLNQDQLAGAQSW